ncbi:MAG TPA: alanine racemase [Steroidobacteraceae bacterium]
MRFPRATIDRAALRHNLGVVRAMAPGSRVIAVIKANGYGHGLVETARALTGADAFGVARLDEGLALRAAGIVNEIVLLEGVFSSEELQLASAARLQLVVHSFEQLQLLEQACDIPSSQDSSGGFTVWLKIDTGMNRLGFRREEFETAWQRLRRCRCVRTARVMTHLAAAEEPDSPATRGQIESFRALTDSLNVERSVANSAGLIASPQARVDWVRPGLMLYGISPIPSQSAAQLGLRPAMTLTTQIIALRRVPKAESVGYSAIWRASRDSVVGIAAIGYGDGYPRNMRNGTPVLVNGKEVSVVGRVSMDMTAIDVTNSGDVRVGDPVVLWGEGLPAERVAPYADTISYELVCGISQRVAVEWQG